jgi:hypothetical protein
MARPWTPEDLGGKVRSWLDPETNVTKSGSNVTSWQSRSSDATTLSNINGTLTTDTYNDATVLDYTTTSVQLVASVNAAWDLDPTEPTLFELYTFVRIFNSSSSMVISLSNGGANEQYELGFSASTSSVFVAYGGGGDSRTANNSLAPDGSPYTIGMLSTNGTTFAASIDGVLDTTPQAIGSETNSGNLTVGMRQNVSLAFNGQQGDIILVDPLEEDERYRLLAWMGHRYGHNTKLSVANPYRLDPPTVSTGGLILPRGMQVEGVRL